MNNQQINTIDTGVRRSKNARSPFRRRGAATIEMAIISPLLFLLFFAGLEFSRANLMKNVADAAALEGARAGIIAGAQSSDCMAAAVEQLEIVHAQDFTVTVEPLVIDQNTPEITVTVSLPCSSNAMPMSKFVLGKTLSRSITLSREVFEEQE